MKILIGNQVFDSTKEPVLLVFDQEEAELFELNRYVSAPEDSTVEQRQKLIETDLSLFESK